MNPLPVIPESLFDLVTIEDPQISPDGRMVAFVRMQADVDSNGYLRSIWIAPADGRAAPRRLTYGGRSDHSPRWSPDGKRLLFLSARGGDPQLYRLPLEGGEPSRLTYFSAGVSNPTWSPDGKWIAFNACATRQEAELEEAGVAHNPILRQQYEQWLKAEREALRDPRVITRLPYRTGTSFFDGQYQHVYIMPAEGGAPKRLSSGDFHHSAPDWTPDSRFVVTNSNREQSSGEENFELWSSILRYDIESGAEHIVAFEVSEEGRKPLVSPDGKWVAHALIPKVESPYAEPYYIAVTPMEGGESKIVSGEMLTVADFLWDADSAHLLLIVHDHGDARLVRISLDGESVETLLDGPRWIQAFSLSRDGKRVAYTVSSPAHPGDLFTADLPECKERQLTAFNAEWEKAHFLSLPQEIRYKGVGDVEIQGWYFRPKDFDPKKSYPLAVEIHGGPQIMWGNSFWHEFQSLCGRGYFVFFCNPRGSAGYGAEFQRLRGKGGYTDMPDIMTGLDLVLEREPAADPNRLVVTGGSYGGFLTGWIVTHTDRFKAAVSQRGVYDELNMFGSGDIPESTEWYHNGIPREENLKELWEYSPAAHAANVTTPLMIKHAELDYRVPVSQAETFFAALRRRGNRTTIMVRYPREGHELSRGGEPNHRIDRLHKIIEWFDRHVQPEKLRPQPLSAQALKEALAGLRGWSLNDNALEREIECGKPEIAVQFLNRISELAGQARHYPTLSIEGSRLKLRLITAEAGMVCEADVALARRLNRRALEPGGVAGGE